MTAPPTGLMSLLDELGARVEGLAANFASLPSDGAKLANAWAAMTGTGTGLRAVTDSLVILLIGGGVEWLFWCYAIGRARAIEATRPVSYRSALLLALERLGLKLFGLALFAICALGASSVFVWPDGVHDGVVALTIAVTGWRSAWAIAEFWLSPRHFPLRVLALPTRHARRWFRVTLLSAFMIDMGWLGRDLIGRTIGAVGAAALIEAVAGLALAITLISAILGTGRARRPRRAVSSILPFIGAALVVGAILLALLDYRARAALLVILGGVFLLDRLFGVVIDRLAGVADAEGHVTAGEAEPAAAIAVYRSVLRGLTRLLLAVAALGLASLAGDMRMAEMTRGDGWVGRALGGVTSAAVFALGANFVWLWVKTTIDHRLALIAPQEHDEDSAGDGGGAAGPNARLATLLPLLRNAVKILLIGFVILSGLSSLGFDIGPLLAGASVLGIAIGFGAQTLVRDIITGVFFLLEDAFRIGEYIEFGNIRGTVEGISLRSFRLRHHRGQIHTVPFGEVKSLTNYSRDWAIMKLEFRVPFDTDLRLAKRIVKQIAADLQADEELGPSLLQPLKFQGVTRMEEFSMVVGVKFMAKPGEQFTLRREAYHRIRDAFTAQGIKFPDRSVRVDMGDYDGPPVPMAVLATAADEMFSEVGPIKPT